MTKEDTEALIEALNDPDKFAAANVLLIGLYGFISKEMPNQAEDDPDSDDTIAYLSGMRVDLKDEKVPVYDSRDRKLLLDYWKKKLAKKEEGKK